MNKQTKKETMSAERRKEALIGWLFLTPEIIGMVLLYVLPIIFAVLLSFTEWNLVGGLSEIRFVGLDNFIRLFNDERVFIALRNNLVYTAIVVPVSMLLALVLATLINAKVHFKSFFKVAFFIPYISSIIAVGAIWRALYHPSQGPINQLLMALGITEVPGWLASTNTSLIAIIIISIWAQIGYVVVIYLAGLANIPPEVYEAAEMDGANSLQKFYKITFPLLKPTHMFLAITLLITSFKVFDLIKFLTDGGPINSSSVLVYLIYQEGFQRFNMGYASAISILLFAVVASLTFLTWKLQNSKVFGS
ncbi:MAG: carbohydrate ABC transporter permease [Bacillota bacterium]